MTPISFPEQTTVWAENQKEFLPLPAFTNERETISCWRLTPTERLYLLVTGKLWLRQCNFGEPLQAQLPTVSYPFTVHD